MACSSASEKSSCKHSSLDDQMEQRSSQDAAPALSIRQPWLELILRGLKSIELRTWTTDYRGPLWLHAPMKMDRFHDQLALGEARLFLGGYVGCAVLRTILPIDARRWEGWRLDHRDPGPYAPGYFGWVLSDVVRFGEPLSAPGRLGLFQPTAEHLAILLRRCKEGRPP
jgi:ASCH domain